MPPFNHADFWYLLAKRKMRGIETSSKTREERRLRRRLIAEEVLIRRHSFRCKWISNLHLCKLSNCEEENNKVLFNASDRKINCDEWKVELSILQVLTMNLGYTYTSVLTNFVLFRLVHNAFDVWLLSVYCHVMQFITAAVVFEQTEILFTSSLPYKFGRNRKLRFYGWLRRCERFWNRLSGTSGSSYHVEPEACYKIMRLVAAHDRCKLIVQELSEWINTLEEPINADKVEN